MEDKIKKFIKPILLNRIKNSAVAISGKNRTGFIPKKKTNRATIKTVLEK